MNSSSGYDGLFWPNAKLILLLIMNEYHNASIVKTLLAHASD